MDYKFSMSFLVQQDTEDLLLLGDLSLDYKTENQTMVTVLQEEFELSKSRKRLLSYFDTF